MARKRNVWLGGIKTGLTLTKESWSWVDGSPMDYTYWYPANPDNYYNDEFCLSAWDNGKWNDFPCSGISSDNLHKVVAYICQQNPNCKYTISAKLFAPSTFCLPCTI